MHLLTIVYFMSYHTFSTAILRKTHFFESNRRSFVGRCLQIGAMAYVTAVMEAWTISAFPHYVGFEAPMDESS